jgi:hypothetical protein
MVDKRGLVHQLTDERDAYMEALVQMEACCLRNPASQIARDIEEVLFATPKSFEPM